MGRWTLLDLRQEQQAIAEAGVRNPVSGFTAVISAAGYMMPYQARLFSQAFGAQVAAGARRLGDIWCGTFAALGGSQALDCGTWCCWVTVASRAARPNRAWNIDRLVAGTGAGGDPYADLLDQDGDGFATWIEAQAGTGALVGGMRINRLALPQDGTYNPQATAPDPAAPGLALDIETLAGIAFRVVTTDDLGNTSWIPVPWRPAGGRMVDRAHPWRLAA